MNEPKTIEQARALPEVTDIWSAGFGPGGVTGDSIILFVDADGRAMRVADTKDGFVKTPWRGL